MLVAPAVPTNDPKSSLSRRAGLIRKLRFAVVRAILKACFSQPAQMLLFNVPHRMEIEGLLKAEHSNMLEDL